MDLGIRNKNALITGSSKGLGRESALALAKEGVNIILCARGAEDLENTKNEIRKLNINLSAYQTDISNIKELNNLIDKINKDVGNIDILVNNVGGSLGTSDLLNSKIEDFQKVMDANLWSAVTLMKLLVPNMQKINWGRVINISSIYGREFGGTAPYMTAKAAMIASTKHLAMTIAKDGVTVNSIAPGSILFPGGSWDRFIKNNSEETVNEFIERNLPMGKFGWPEPIGAAVTFLSSMQADLITGACINIDGGQSHNLF